MHYDRVEVRFALLAAVCLGALCMGGSVSAAGPYAMIYERNAFGLRPPQPVTVIPAEGPAPKVHLTGITTILQDKRALFKVEYPAKPRERAKEESFILTEGQKAGPIEVLEIDVKKARVKVKNSGTVTTLMFEKTGPAPAAPQRTPLLPPRFPLATRIYRR
ncbi:MAG TPA: hypothetical protein VHI52_03665 [Verrucomicrobiae bacterium]|nr:hypothetical protein [Verrucomicrobiae bacterium]